MPDPDMTQPGERLRLRADAIRWAAKKLSEAPAGDPVAFLNTIADMVEEIADDMFRDTTVRTPRQRRQRSVYSLPVTTGDGEGTADASE